MAANERLAWRGRGKEISRPRSAMWMELANHQLHRRPGVTKAILKHLEL